VCSVGVEFWKVLQFGRGAVGPAGPPVLSRALSRRDSPVLFNSQDVGDWYFDGLAVAAYRRDTESPRDLAAVDQNPHSGDTDTPAPCQLAWSQRLKLDSLAGHSTAISILAFSGERAYVSQGGTSRSRDSDSAWHLGHVLRWSRWNHFASHV
jgi:hypothetical protein